MPCPYSDGTLRHWEWGSESNKPDKSHTYESTDNLAKVSKKYKVAIPDIIKWNGIKDVKKIYIGQKLIVTKGNHDEPTAMELQAERTKAKMQVREAAVQGKIEKAMKAAEVSEQSEAKRSEPQQN